MTSIKGFFAFLFALALVIFGGPAIFVLPAEFTVFNPGAYKQALVEEKVYSNLPRWIGLVIKTEGLPNGEDALVENAFAKMTPDEYAFLVELILPPDAMQRQVEAIMDQVSKFLDGEVTQPAFVFDLRDVKKRLGGSEGIQMVELMLKSWPVCTPEQLGKIGKSAVTGEAANIPLCQPPEVSMPLVNPFIQAELTKMSAALPDEIKISDQEVFSDPNNLAIGTIWGLRSIFRATLAASVLLFILLLVINLPLSRSTMRWTGIPLLIVGLISLITIAIVGTVGVMMFDSARQTADPLVTEVVGALINVVSTVGGRFLIFSGVTAFLVTLAGVVLTFFIRPNTISNPAYTLPHA